VSGNLITVWANGADLGGSVGAALVDDGTELLSADVELAVRAVLSHIQDEIMKYLAAQWPIDVGGKMGMPYARSDAMQVWSGFAREDGTNVIPLRPIRFSDLTGGPCYGEPP
jgi:hypothetical protein